MVTSKTIASNKIGKEEFTKKKVLDANNKWESPEGPGYQQKVGRNQELVETRDISGLDGVWTKQKEIAWNQQRLGCQSTNNVNNIYIYLNTYTNRTFGVQPKWVSKRVSKCMPIVMF